MPELRPNTSPTRDPEGIGRSNARLLLSTFGVLAAAMLMLGCGLEGQPFDSTTRNDDPVVSAEQVSAEEPGSPRFTVLQWWRGVQTRNPQVVMQSYAPDVRDELPETFDLTVIAVLAPAASESSITIDSVAMKGANKATLVATIDSQNAAMKGPVALPMKKVGDEWLLANDSFLPSLSGAFALEQALQESTAPSSKEKKPSKAKEPTGGLP